MFVLLITEEDKLIKRLNLLSNMFSLKQIFLLQEM